MVVVLMYLSRNLTGASFQTQVLPSGQRLIRVGFAGSSQFLEDISPLDDPFAIVQCQNYTITIDFWLTDWQGANVKAMDYYFTWDTDLLTVESVTCKNLNSRSDQ